MLEAISPIDGRYHRKTEKLRPYFSEFGLIKYRVRVEIEYFIALTEIGLPELKPLSKEEELKLRTLYRELTPEKAEEIKTIEKTTNHDIKAIEYYIKNKWEYLGISQNSEFVHFALTSQDINNTAVPLSIKEAMSDVLTPEFSSLIETLNSLEIKWEEQPMLAHTHGQPASPTRLGKEIGVFRYRLEKQWKNLMKLPLEGKFGGATGNFNAHYATYTKLDWKKFADDFLQNRLGLQRQQYTTQIENYDQLAALFQNLIRIQTILIDLTRDFWAYISMGYFKQKVIADEVGSSAMPHKVNPIDFENAEGNLGVGRAIFTHLSQKMPVSRLQRDLTDSTVSRNIGVPFAHTLIALQSIQKGLSKLELHSDSVHEDLEKNWMVVAEAIQNVLRRENYPKPYEALKSFTRGKTKIGKKEIREFIDALDIDAELKKSLKTFTPFNYTGK
jgi:adenylosuccinate lyase